MYNLICNKKLLLKTTCFKGVFIKHLFSQYTKGVFTTKLSKNALICVLLVFNDINVR